MKVIGSKGSVDSPFYSVAAAVGGLGAIPFTQLFSTSGEGGQAGTAIRIRGRLVSPTGGGSVAIRACLICDGVVPAPGSAVGNALACKNVYGSGSDADAPNLATTAAVSFSAVYYIQSGALLPMPAPDVSFRLSNPGSAYTAGTVYIDTVELLG